MSKKKRKKKEKERRRILEKKLAEKEKELKLLAAQNTEELAPVKKKSIKVSKKRWRGGGEYFIDTFYF